jgi:hypothetical protein
VESVVPAASRIGGSVSRRIHDCCNWRDASPLMKGRRDERAFDGIQVQEMLLERSIGGVLNKKI